MKPSIQPEQLCSNTPNAQHIRQVWAQAILRQPEAESSGVGKRLVRNGKSSGQPSLPLQRVVNNSLNVAPSLPAMQARRPPLGNNPRPLSGKEYEFSLNN